MQGEELTDRFLRILTDLAVNHCLTGESTTMTMRPGLLYFVAVDAYVRLLTMLITGAASPTLCHRWLQWCNYTVAPDTFLCPADCEPNHRLHRLPHKH